jgi:hypothetical protein
MAIVAGPLFSLQASQTFGKTLTYQKQKGIQVARIRPTHDNPDSSSQNVYQAFFANCILAWRTVATLTLVSETWADLVKQRRMKMTPLEFWCKTLITAATHATKTPRYVKTWGWGIGGIANIGVNYVILYNPPGTTKPLETGPLRVYRGDTKDNMILVYYKASVSAVNITPRLGVSNTWYWWTATINGTHRAGLRYRKCL